MRELITVGVSPHGARVGAKLLQAGSAVPQPQLKVPKLLRFEQLEVDGFAGWVAALEQLARQPDRFPLRGELIEPPSSQSRRRLAFARAGEADGAATLRDEPKRQLLLDLDTDPEQFPEPFLPLGREYAAEVWGVIGALVPELRGAECWFSFTASAGFRSGVRMRFGLWLAEPVSCDQARRWCRDLEARLGFALFDASLYTVTQPTYCAPPVLVGVADPIPQRSGVLSGNPCGPLPTPTGQQIRAKGKPRQDLPEVQPLPEGEAQLLPEPVERWLAQIQPGAFNRPIVAAVSVALRLGCDPVAIQLRLLEVVAARGGPERLERWQRELPQLLASIGAKERERREQELLQTRPHPGCDVPAVPLHEAEARLREAVEGWSLKARGYAPSRAVAAPSAGGRLLVAPVDPLLLTPPPRQLLAVDVGLGKTRAAVEAVRDLLRDSASEVARVVYLIPTHQLGDEIAAQFVALGVTAKVWRGVQAVDSDGAAMCEQPELVREALQASVSVRDVCAKCPSRASCRYQAQHQAQPEVWVASHDYLFREPPKPLRSAQALVVDEAFWSSAIRTGARVKFEALGSDTGPLRGDDAQRLADARAILCDKLHQLEVGEQLTREDLEGFALGESDLAAAYKLEWQRKPSAKGLDAQTVEELREAVAVAGCHSFQQSVPKLWALVDATRTGPGADGRLPGFITRTAEGVELSYRREPWEGWLQMPALLLDATAAPQLVEAALGVPVAVTQIRAELPPGVEVLQVRDTAMPRRSLHRKPTEGGAGFDRARERRREDLAAMLEVQAAMHRGELCGAILQKDPERLLREEAGERLEQAGVQLAHFGAIRGLDGWRDCRSLVVVGRPLPPPREIEALAAVLFGRQIEPVGESYPQALVRLAPSVEGTPEAVEVACHPDPQAEAVRLAVCEGELVQAVGRARAVRRDRSRPLSVILAGCTPVPGLVPHRLALWGELVPSTWQVIAARHKVLPLAPAGLVKAGGWQTPAAARKAMQRLVGERVDIPLEETLTKQMSHLFQAPTLYRYRLLGQRGSPSLALGDGDPRLAQAALVALLGQVALWEAVEQAAVAAAVAAPALAPSPPVAAPVALEAQHPAAPPDPEGPPLDPREARRQLLEVHRYGATPQRLAARCGVSIEKLRRHTAAIRKRISRVQPPERGRELLRQHEPVMGFIALSDLVPAAKFERGIQELALEALARREALTRGHPLPPRIPVGG